MEDMLGIYKEIGATYIISPDWPGDITKTLEAYYQMVEALGKERVIGVAQGTNFSEIIQCALLMSESPLVAIPYDTYTGKVTHPISMGLRRAVIVMYLSILDIKVHLLGYTTQEELGFYKGLDNVLSLDTGVPVMLGLQEMDILDLLPNKEKPTMSQMEGISIDPSKWSGICRNIALLRKMLVK